MVGLHSQSVSFDRSLLCLRRYNIQRGITLVVCLCQLTRSFSVCSLRITKFSHPPTLGWGPGGQPYAMPTRPSYISLHPSRAAMYKSHLSSIPILSYCPVTLLLCSLLVSLCRAGTSAVRRWPPRRGRAPAYHGGKQSYCLTLSLTALLPPPYPMALGPIGPSKKDEKNRL
jgi:hypothetical protein